MAECVPVDFVVLPHGLEDDSARGVVSADDLHQFIVGQRLTRLRKIFVRLRLLLGTKFQWRQIMIHNVFDLGLVFFAKLQSFENVLEVLFLNSTNRYHSISQHIHLSFSQGVVATHLFRGSGQFILHHLVFAYYE